MYRLLAVICAVLVVAGSASAVVVTLPDETQSTTFTATVSEQADVTVPASVAFTVGDVSSSTDSAAQTVSATTVVLTNGQALRVELQGDAADFTPPAGGTVTWAAGDISWNAATWSNGTGASGTLSSAAYTKLADTDANAASTTTNNLVFTLAAKATVDRAGDHTLAATWKFSSITP
jgi:hypothetical protein